MDWKIRVLDSNLRNLRKNRKKILTEKINHPVYNLTSIVNLH
jgi:hypothetical protein